MRTPWVDPLPSAYTGTANVVEVLVAPQWGGPPSPPPFRLRATYSPAPSATALSRFRAELRRRAIRRFGPWSWFSAEFHARLAGYQGA